MIVKELTWDSCELLWPIIVQKFGSTPLTNLDVMKKEREVISKYYGDMIFKQYAFYKEGDFVGIFFSYTEDYDAPNSLENDIDQINWPELCLDVFQINTPFLILPEYFDECMCALPTPFQFNNYYPDFTTPGTQYSVQSGITDLQKGDDFLSSLKTKKRSYLKKRMQEEEWDKLDIKIECNKEIPDEFWKANSKYWHDFWLPRRDKEIAEYDAKTILFTQELTNCILQSSNAEDVIVTTVSKDGEVLGYNLALSLNWRHVEPQIISINSFKADYNSGIHYTHAIHFTNIDVFYKKAYKWYCLGTIDEEEDGYGVYKVHFRNGKFKSISNYCIGNHWIPSYVCPPYYCNGKIITDDTDFERTIYGEEDEVELATYKRQK